MIGDPTAPGGMAQPGHVPGAPGRSAGSGGGGGGISELKQHLQVLKGFFLGMVYEKNAKY